MPYDDDDDRFGRNIRDLIELEAILRRYFSVENLSVSKVKSLLRSLGQLTTEKTVDELTISEIQGVLKRENLENLPTSTVMEMLKLVEPISQQEGDLFDRITLNDVEKVLFRSRPR